MERFKTEEWQELMLLPFVAFCKVASADGAIQSEEAAEFVDQLKSDAFCGDPLRRNLSQSILAADFMDLFNEAKEKTRWSDHLRKSRRILRQHLDDDEYRRFAGSLVLFGLDVAMATDRSDGAMTKTPSEDAALIELAETLGLDPDDLEKLRHDPTC